MWLRFAADSEAPAALEAGRAGLPFRIIAAIDRRTNLPHARRTLR